MNTAWKSVKLGDIATFSNGVNFGKDAYSSGVKLISVSDFGNRYYPNYSSLDEIDRNVLRESDFLKDGDIVFVRSNGNKELVGRCMLIQNPPCDVTYSGFCIRARLNDFKDHDPKFYAYYFKSDIFRKSMANSASGANIQNLNQGLLFKHVISLPPIGEQKQIASILSAYDNLIENNNKRIKILEQMAENLYKEWFVRFRFPGHESTPLENGIPKGWKVEKTGKFCKIITGKKDANEASGNGLYPFFTCARETNLSTDEYILDTNAILISGNGSFTGFVKKFSGKFDLYQRTYALYDFIDVEWLYLYWTFKFEFEREYMGGSHGSAIPYITKPNIEKFKIIVPSKDIQKRSQEIFEYVHLECIKLRDENNNLIKQRDLLLPRLMSGKLAV